MSASRNANKRGIPARGGTKPRPSDPRSRSFTPDGKVRSAVWALVPVVVLIAINVSVYAPLGHYDFVSYDDPAYVSENPHIAQGLTWPAVKWALTAGYCANWHPLTWISHMLDVQAFGLNPGYHHLTSFLLHMLTTLLLFGVLVRMTGAPGRSAFAAALFAVHPLHVESVAWIAERKDVLCGFFWVTTLWAYLAYVRRPRFGSYLLVTFSFGLSLLAKPMAVTLPFALLLLDAWPLKRIPGLLEANVPAKEAPGADPKPSVRMKLVVEKLPLVAMSAASCIATYVAQEQGTAISGLVAFPLVLRLENMLISYVAYAGGMLWPVRLAALYPYPPSYPVWAMAGAALILAVVSLIAIRTLRRYPYLFVGWFWFLGTLVPVIGIVQVGVQSRADRYTYLPLIGLFIVVAWAGYDLLARSSGLGRRLAAIAAGLVVLACAARARDQLHYWQNGITLWTQALEVATGADSCRAHNSLGLVLKDQGRLDEAAAHFAEAVRLKPDFAEANHNLGLVLAQQGRFDLAVAPLAEAARANPRDAELRSNLGFALSNLGRGSEAIEHFEQALRLQPDLAQVHNALGCALAAEKRTADALSHFSAAVRLKPDYFEAYDNMGLAFAGQGRIAEAIAQFTAAVRLNGEYPKARNNLGMALAAQGRLDEAIVQYGEAVRLAPDFEIARLNLGLALADIGKRDDAVQQLAEVLRLNPQNQLARQALDSLTRRK
jgi:tetratricopeptide (TPR) repeat protein